MSGQNSYLSGALQTYEISHEDMQGSLKEILDVEKQNSFKCATFGSAHIQTRFVATGDFNGTLSTWDLENPGLPVYEAKAHKVG